MVALSSLTLFLTPTGHAGQVTGFDLFNTHIYSQPDANPPGAPFDYSFSARIFLDSPLTTAQAFLFPPGASQGISMGTSGDLFITPPEDFGTQGALDMAFPSGQYIFTLNSPQLTPTTAETGQLVVPMAASYSNVPYFTNFAATQNIDPTKPFAFTWNPLVTYQAPLLSEIYFSIYDVTANSVTLGTNVPDNTATSYVVPANTFLSGHHYYATIDFSIRNSTAGTGLGNVNGLLGYDSSTIIDFFPRTVSNDFNGDGRPDYLFFRPSDLRTYVWFMNGPTATSSASGPTLPAGWSAVGVGDFNGDGQPDLLLFHASDLRTYVWYMNGPNVFSSAPGPTLPAGWSVLDVGDFNGDGQPDLLLLHASDLRTYIYYMHGPTAFSSAPGPTLPAGWSMAGLGDFNGDGKPDLLFFNPTSLRTYVWYLNGPNVSTSAPGPTLPSGWSVAGVADFNSDSKPDLLLVHAGDLRTYVWYMNGVTVFSSAPGSTLPAGWNLVSP